MAECTVAHIPERLHKGDKPPIDVFEVGEQLYMRCSPEQVDNPYKAISITELSHNRQGLQQQILSEQEDVLYSIKSDDGFEKYPDKVACVLKIKSLNQQSQFRKEYSESKNNQQHNAAIQLLHEPESCMYPHCVFRVWVDQQVITYENYNTTIKRLNKIRNSLKEELASMIIKRQVSQEDSPA